MQKSNPVRIIAGVLLAITALFAFFAPQTEVFYGEGAWTPMMIIFGVLALAAVLLLTLGTFMGKKALLITGSTMMLTVAVASLVFCIIGLATGGGGYSYYSSYRERWYHHRYFNDAYYGFSMFSQICALTGWVLVFIACLKKRGGKVPTIIAAGMFLLALIFMVCACVDSDWNDAMLFTIFRWIYYFMLLQALVLFGIALPAIKQKAAAPADYQPYAAQAGREAPQTPAPYQAPAPYQPPYQAPAPYQAPEAVQQPEAVPEPEQIPEPPYVPVPEAEEIEDAVNQIEEAVQAEAEEAADVTEEAPELVKAAEDAADEPAGAEEAAEEAAEELKKELPDAE